MAVSCGPAPGARQFYVHTMSILNEAGLDYLVGGGHALEHYTGIERQTKDFDIFVRRDDYERIMRVLDDAGYHTDLTFPHWLGKASCEHGYIDVIFNSGNGVTVVDDAWFQHAAAAQVFGVPARICPAEEIIWSKAFVMERERYDCADIMHLLLTCATRLDWPRLVGRFGAHWRVLFSHLSVFGFVYPSERARIPDWVMSRFLGLLEMELREPPPTHRICQGTLLSREQYLVDVQRWGFADVRQTGASTMTASEIVLWTEAIQDSK
ncbi:MAG TPA: nucleotidyltransferase [Steroidobacteraceae bacterium]|nr:nucleotidyltransferase [Steroidobacteraceae bacterium]